jgi:hypothetical protein
LAESEKIKKALAIFGSSHFFFLYFELTIPLLMKENNCTLVQYEGVVWLFLGITVGVLFLGYAWG